MLMICGDVADPVAVSFYHHSYQFANRNFRCCSLQKMVGVRKQCGQWHVRSSLAKRLSVQARATSTTVEQYAASEVWEEESSDFTAGPLSGDLAEVEAFCRIQRLAEDLHKAVMDSLRKLETQSWGESSAFSSSLEERVAAGLACVGATLQQGRLDILGGWVQDNNEEREKEPRLARFRKKLRVCLKSLQTSLQSLLAAEGDQNMAIYRILQGLINLCLDAGFVRPAARCPDYGSIPNFGRVRLEQTDETVAFWRGGQFTEGGLKWLLDNGFKTIVDLRAEDPDNTLAESALIEAEQSGKIKRVKVPVNIETAPSMDQVREFAKLVDDAESQPLFLHGYAGAIRTSAMISRWREFVVRGGLKCEEADGESEVCEVDDLWPEDNVQPAEVPPNETEEPSAPSDSPEGTRPFHAQAPGPDVFSRKAMSKFFKNKRISPRTVMSTRLSLVAGVTASLVNGKEAKAEKKNETGKSVNGAASRSSATAVDHTLVGGADEMCSTKTGVVRIQSRRKAEMYLVRTDGFSCTRERVMESTLAFTHPSTQQQMLMWKTPPKTVLLLKKLGDELMQEAKEVASFLHHREGMNVMVEPDVHDRFARYAGFGFIQTFYSHDIGSLHERVDFVVCLGGDGVILHASNLFRNAVPPVVSFNLGSLGFLTAHPFEDYKRDLQAIIRGSERIEGVYVTLRMRLRCEILRDGQPVPGKVFEVLNEVVVDRGSNPYLCKIECYERKRLITKVQADGVLVATPTGSTAYSTAAGGSMVHPNVPCMLFTPICPHSLSFRPVILPDSAILELKVPDDARSNAFVSFDGKRKQPLNKGESILVCMSQHPMSTVNKRDQTNDWFASLSRCFGWNQRAEQKSFEHS